jgi:hypothetical protein
MRACVHVCAFACVRGYRSVCGWTDAHTRDNIGVTECDLRKANNNLRPICGGLKAQTVRVAVHDRCVNCCSIAPKKGRTRGRPRGERRKAIVRPSQPPAAPIICTYTRPMNSLGLKKIIYIYIYIFV